MRRPGPSGSASSDRKRSASASFASAARAGSSSAGRRTSRAAGAVPDTSSTSITSNDWRLLIALTVLIALFALPLAYSYPFQFGFVNFALSMGIALNLFDDDDIPGANR